MAANPAPPCEVWAENWKAFLLFSTMGSQWRSGMNGATGLDYAALPVAARGLGVKLTRARFAQIREMERAAIDSMREARAQKSAGG